MNEHNTDTRSLYNMHEFISLLLAFSFISKWVGGCSYTTSTRSHCSSKPVGNMCIVLEGNNFSHFSPASIRRQLSGPNETVPLLHVTVASPS